MADYYPVISSAVAALEENSEQNRRALYKRARDALLTQLRGVTPALNESHIADWVRASTWRASAVW
jgi:hypothetical protein